jgi:hypothetical protein
VSEEIVKLAKVPPLPVKQKAKYEDQFNFVLDACQAKQGILIIFSENGDSTFCAALNPETVSILPQTMMDITLQLVGKKENG